MLNDQFAIPFGPSLSDYRFAQNDLYCTYVLGHKIVCEEQRVEFGSMFRAYRTSIEVEGVTW